MSPLCVWPHAPYLLLEKGDGFGLGHLGKKNETEIEHIITQAGRGHRLAKNIWDKLARMFNDHLHPPLRQIGQSLSLQTGDWWDSSFVTMNKERKKHQEPVPTSHISTPNCQCGVNILRSDVFASTFECKYLHICSENLCLTSVPERHTLFPPSQLGSAPSRPATLPRKKRFTAPLNGRNQVLNVDPPTWVVPKMSSVRKVAHFNR